MTNKPKITWTHAIELVVIAWIAWAAAGLVPVVGGFLRYAVLTGLVVAAAHVYVPGGLVDRAYCAVKDRIFKRSKV